MPDLDHTATVFAASALAYPDTREDHPWGHSAFKVRGKSFLLLSRTAGRLSLSLKLPRSGPFALDLPFVESTGYGLGRSGWITATFEPGDDVPNELLLAWIDESFRAVAPKKLSAALPPL